ncbi:MAG: DUF6089 family protein [Candidatus Cyclobacteriaceae bacterium M2_1C_046]
MRIITAILVVLLFITDTLQAQSFYGSRRNRSTILTVGTGTTSYFGDLNDPGDRFDSKPNANIGLQYFFDERFGARAEVTWFQLEGTDEDVYPSRNLSFKSNNFELNVIGIFDIIPHGRRFYQREAVTPYVFAGVGLVYFNPKAEYQGETYALQPLQTEGVDYSRVAFVVPFGGGVKFKASPFINIGIEVGYRHAFTDYMDDVSTTYVDKSGAPEIERALADRRPEVDLPRWEPGHIRGNPEDNDGYAILNLKLEYYLPGDLFSSGYSRKPPKRRSPRRRR